MNHPKANQLLGMPATPGFPKFPRGDVIAKGQGGLTTNAEDGSSRESAMLVDGRVVGIRTRATARHK